MRQVDLKYRDPLDLIWLRAAEEMGIAVRRSSDVFASWDGGGTLFIGTPETLDSDDTLAQMIFHEVCHALCEWPVGMSLPDWGLESDNPDHRIRELGCLRLQATLASPFGLRHFFAATTVFRKYYDLLPVSPLESGDKPELDIARRGHANLDASGWRRSVEDALCKTARIAEITQDVAPEDSIWRTFEPTSS